MTILRSDRRLITSLSAVPGAVVFGQFTGYLSQYLITVSSAEFAYRIIGLVMIVNASIVIALQYLLSRGMRQENMLRWLALGTLFFIVGLLGFMMAGQMVWLWLAAMAVFTLGEIIVIPVEYMFIDFIAPPHLKAATMGTEPQRAGRRHQPGAVRGAAQLCHAAVDVRDADRRRAAQPAVFFLGHRLAEHAAATAEDAR